MPVEYTIAGRVQRVLFNQDDFYILNMVVASSDSNRAEVGRSSTARGNIFGLVQVKEGSPIRLIGTWRKHKTYGDQFVIRTWRPWAESEEDVEEFLHVCVKDWTDRQMARAMAALHDPEEAYQRLTEEPQSVLDALDAFIPENVQAAILGWERTIATRDLSTLLKDGGLNAKEIAMTITRFGLDAAEIVEANPYQLMSLPGMEFSRVDQLAANLGVPPNDLRRLEGLVLWGLRESSTEGHLYLPRGRLPNLVNDLIHSKHLVDFPLPADKRVEAYNTAIQNLVDRKGLVLVDGRGVYLPDLHEYELESARLLAQHLKPSDIEVDLKPFIEEYERSNRITLSEAQRLAVEKLSQHRVLVLTGLPGTGKTTAVRALVRLFEEADVTFSLMAPTGIAAKRLGAVTGHHASTIHRALRYDGFRWGHHADNRYLVDAVIVDEMSMVDQELFYRLISALREETMLVFVGDDAQLPSVGPGNVLRELVESGDIPNVRLTQIFRQSQKGEIVLNSHKINAGEMLTFADPKTDTEFKFVRISDEDRIVSLIIEMAAKLKGRDANFQVLSSKYKGTVGVDNLNDQLRDRLNPEGPKEWKEGNQHFRVGDRVMVTQNDYARSVYNGDVGKLIRIHKEGLVVRIHGVEDGLDMEVDFGPLRRDGRKIQAANDKLQLAYAITVHKSQGSEFDTIIMPMVRSQGWMLQRNLFYTGVTRAKKRVWVIGEEVAIQRAIMNNKVVKRFTGFAQAITEHLSGVEDQHGRDDERERDRASGADQQAESSPS